SAVVFCSLPLLIRGHQRARCQAEIPPTAPSEIVEPLLSDPFAGYNGLRLKRRMWASSDGERAVNIG
ncbi:MAG: hypothetical protein ACLPJY_08860, partial [Rhodomicrobium sp.]